MSFDDKRNSGQQQNNESPAGSEHNATQHPKLDGRTVMPKTKESSMAQMLDNANNRLQELLQLLYLLSRDPAVPTTARCHVTVAQSEIALLALVMRNSAESIAEPQTRPNTKSFSAAHP
jgi:hypothetical protein